MKDADACITPASVAAMAQIAGVTRLSDEAAKALAPDVDARLREIIQDAQKFARHAKRVRLTPDDVNAALRLRNFEPMFGYVASKQPKEFARLPGHPDVSIVRDRELSFEQVRFQARLRGMRRALGRLHGAGSMGHGGRQQHGVGNMGHTAWDGRMGPASSNAHSCEPSHEPSHEPRMSVLSTRPVPCGHPIG